MPKMLNSKYVIITLFQFDFYKQLRQKPNIFYMFINHVYTLYLFRLIFRQYCTMTDITTYNISQLCAVGFL